ncbi:hypothetical protein SERLADRAFT_412019 [Serpula lacrymans var. lacrymans S7.9]|uniref:Uncharacterized protein n=1 Tax=Serpula lacrymans var. lacrymans (strain S7.9) TaxID=578457 RepID=F8PDE3_SERL9|nr:uncharacterized protein SERLADRAFT_412019 [Serpula lacrymans var. lacrymans S7.9]EGO18764.1 hypothetical protein SERLADRAFT_412019 [Serpula lacrymans var. lacrymans S7.9]
MHVTEETLQTEYWQKLIDLQASKQRLGAALESINKAGSECNVGEVGKCKRKMARQLLVTPAGQLAMDRMKTCIYINARNYIWTGPGESTIKPAPIIAPSTSLESASLPLLVMPGETLQMDLSKTEEDLGEEEEEEEEDSIALARTLYNVLHVSAGSTHGDKVDK